MGNDFKIGLSTFEAIFELFGQKYTQKSTLLTKLPKLFIEIKAKRHFYKSKIKPPPGLERVRFSRNKPKFERMRDFSPF